MCRWYEGKKNITQKRQERKVLRLWLYYPPGKIRSNYQKFWQNFIRSSCQVFILPEDANIFQTIASKERMRVKLENKGILNPGHIWKKARLDQCLNGTLSGCPFRKRKREKEIVPKHFLWNTMTQGNRFY